jgi:hypothetical protein
MAFDRYEVRIQSDEYGTERLTYESLNEALAVMTRMAVEGLDDKVERWFSIREIEEEEEDGTN